MPLATKDPNDSTTPSISNLQRSEVDTSRALIHHGSSALPSPSLRPPTYELHELNLGFDIVNSVVVQLLPAGCEGHEEHIVAILTWVSNNDKSVIIFSLTRLELLECLGPYPTYMNHACISPDGKLLIAVGDKPQAFFSRRVLTDVTGKGKSGWNYKWQRICEPQLSLANIEDCCFTTAFSPSGHICAAASQGGVVTIFNTALITEDMDGDHAVIAALQSSRLNISSYRGAIRSMSFSPGPWDLLALAEDQGRVIVVDLRNGLQSEQTVKLDPRSPDLVQFALREEQSTLAESQRQNQRRILELQDAELAARERLAAVTNTADYMEDTADLESSESEDLNNESQALRSDPNRLTDSERQSIDATGSRRARATNYDTTYMGYAAYLERSENEDLNNESQALRSDPNRLTNSERQIIDAIGSRRTRVTNVDPPTPISVNYPPNPNRVGPVTPSLTGPNSSSNALSRQGASLAEYIRQQHSERPRPGIERSYQPRRRSSVVISNSNPTLPSHSSNLGPIGTVTPLLSASPSHVATTSSEPTPPSQQESWGTVAVPFGGANTDVSAQMRRLDGTVAQMRNTEHRVQTSGSGDGLSQSQQLQQSTAPNEHQRRQRGQLNLNAERLGLLRIRRPRIHDDGMALNDMLGTPDSADGVTTMGIGWSPDGRHL
ncbi:MAG: hypothetical protein Q9163_002232 [Psora crenata]